MWRRALLFLLVAAGALALAANASASPGDLTFDSCSSDAGSAGTCADLPGDGAFLSPSFVAISPDGKSLYAVGRNSDTLTHFTVGADSRLTFESCFSDNGSGGACTDVPRSFLNLNGLAVSPDGDAVYVSAQAPDSVSRFSADASGKLTLKECFSNDGSGGACTNIPGSAFDDPAGVAISPDGDSLYVAATTSDSVSHFFVDSSGMLTGYGGCVSNDGSGGFCADVPGSAFDGPTTLVVNPASNALFVASAMSGSVTHFSAVDPGQITFRDCVSDDGSGGTCTDVPGSAFDSPGELVVSPDGNSLYAAARLSDSVSHFFVSPTGLLTFGDCVSQDGSAGTCTDLPGSAFDDPSSLGISPDGTSVYATAFTSTSITHLKAAPAGQLTFGSCASKDGSAGACTDLPGTAFDQPRGISVSPSGGSVYVTAGAAFDFSRELPPGADTTPPEVTLTLGKGKAGKPVKVTISCSEACSVDITGTAKPKGSKPGTLNPASTDLGAGEAATLKLKPKGKLRKALRNRGKGKATINVTATDASGNAVDASERLKLK